MNWWVITISMDQRKSTVNKLKHHLAFFVTNLYAVSRRDPTKYISFPKNRSVYSDPKSKYKKSYKLSYRYSVEQGEEGKGVIPFLEHKGYIEVTPGINDRTGEREIIPVPDESHRETDGFHKPPSV